MGRQIRSFIGDIIVLTLFMYVVSAIVFLLFAQLGIFSALNYWIIIAAIIIIVYFTLMEGITDSTLGKRLFKLKVKAFNGNVGYKKAFIRKFSPENLLLPTDFRCNIRFYIRGFE